MSQRSFASAEYAMKNKRTRREVFLAEMERVVPWHNRRRRADRQCDLGHQQPRRPAGSRQGRAGQARLFFWRRRHAIAHGR